MRRMGAALDLNFQAGHAEPERLWKGALPAVTSPLDEYSVKETVLFPRPI